MMFKIRYLSALLIVFISFGRPASANLGVNRCGLSIATNLPEPRQWHSLLRDLVQKTSAIFRSEQKLWVKPQHWDGFTDYIQSLGVKMLPRADEEKIYGRTIMSEVVSLYYKRGPQTLDDNLMKGLKGYLKDVRGRTLDKDQITALYLMIKPDNIEQTVRARFYKNHHLTDVGDGIGELIEGSEVFPLPSGRQQMVNLEVKFKLENLPESILHGFEGSLQRINQDYVVIFKVGVKIDINALRPGVSYGEFYQEVFQSYRSALLKKNSALGIEADTLANQYANALFVYLKSVDFEPIYASDYFRVAYRMEFASNLAKLSRRQLENLYALLKNYSSDLVVDQEEFLRNPALYFSRVINLPDAFEGQTTKDALAGFYQSRPLSNLEFASGVDFRDPSKLLHRITDNITVELKFPYEVVTVFDEAMRSGDANLGKVLELVYGDAYSVFKYYHQSLGAAHDRLFSEMGVGSFPKMKGKFKYFMDIICRNLSYSGCAI